MPGLVTSESYTTKSALLFVVQVLIRSLLVLLLLWICLRTSDYGYCYDACLNSLSFVLTLSPKHFSGIKVKEA